MTTARHAKCERCGAARHASVRAKLCGRCWLHFEKPRLREEKAMAKQRKANRHGIMNGRAIQEGGVLASLPTKMFDPVTMAVDATVDHHWTPFEATMRQDVAAAFTGAMTEGILEPEEVATMIVDKHPEWRRGDPPTPPSGVKFIPPQQEPTQEPTLKYGRRPALKLTSEQESEIAELFRDGHNTAEIATAYNIGQGRLYQIVKRHGVAFRRQQAATTTTEPQEAPQMPTTSTPPNGTTAAAIESPAPAVHADRPSLPIFDGAIAWTVTYEVRRTETIVVYGDNVGQAYVNANKALGQGAEVIAVQRS